MDPAPAEPSPEAMQAAEAVIANMDASAGVEELEMGASRISVDEKGHDQLPC
jgi:ribonucleoside-diphosphate reductase beta chain